MFCLVVDAFTHNSVGQKRLGMLDRVIRETCTGIGEKCSIQTRRHTDLESFLFLPDEGFHSDAGATQFDKIDMVFIGTIERRMLAPRVALTRP